jgi:hypothetical protein
MAYYDEGIDTYEIIEKSLEYIHYHIRFHDLELSQFAYVSDKSLLLIISICLLVSYGFVLLGDVLCTLLIEFPLVISS